MHDVQQSMIRLYVTVSDVLSSYGVHACGVQTEPKKKLTPEEAAQQAEELRKRIKAKNQVCLASYHAKGFQGAFLHLVVLLRGMQPQLPQCSSRRGLKSVAYDVLLQGEMVLLMHHQV